MLLRSCLKTLRIRGFMVKGWHVGEKVVHLQPSNPLIASWMFSMACSSVAPWDQQPGRPGTQTLYPSSDCCRTTLYLMCHPPLWSIIRQRPRGVQRSIAPDPLSRPRLWRDCVAFVSSSLRRTDSTHLSFACLPDHVLLLVAKEKEPEMA